MPLETATYISQLVDTNPAHTDQVSQGDSHLRLIKSTLLATFASFTGAVVTATEATLNAAATAVAGLGEYLIAAGSAADPTIALLSDDTTGIYSAGAGLIDIAVSGVQAAEFSSSGLTLESGYVYNGMGSVPIGMPMMWMTGTLPTGNWVWLDGSSKSTTGTYANLYALWGHTFGGSGANFNLPNFCEVVPVGQSGMNGAAARSLTSQLSNSGTLGDQIGEGAHTLANSEIPSHNHSVNINSGTESSNHTHNYDYPQFSTSGAGWYSPSNGEYSGAGTQTSGIENESHYHNVNGTTSSDGGGGSHNNVQGSIVVGYICRYA